MKRNYHEHKLPLAWAKFPHHAAGMNKLCIFAGTTIVGYAGWFLGELLHFEFFGCFIISGIGSVVGVYLGWKLAQRLS